MWERDPDEEDLEPMDAIYMDAPIAGLQEVETKWTKWCNAHERVLQDVNRAEREEAQRLRERTRAEEDQRRTNEKADAAEKAAAEKTRNKEALSSRFTTGVRAIGDPDKDIGELITSGISPAALRKKATDIETKLNNLEAVKDQLVALGGEEEAYKWEDMMRNKA